MYISRTSHPGPPAQGITLVEILMVISVLVIIASFAIPSAGKATARAELRATTEHVEHAISAARNLARASESPVSLELAVGADGPMRLIGLSDAAGRPISGWQDYPVPESIQVVSERDRFVFDERGLVENPGSVQLVARADESIQAELLLR